MNTIDCEVVCASAHTQTQKYTPADAAMTRLGQSHKENANAAVEPRRQTHTQDHLYRITRALWFEPCVRRRTQ